MRDGVADCCDGRPAAGLADPERRPVYDRVDQIDGDLGHLAEAQHRIAFPVARADAVLVETHALLQGPAGSLHDAAFKLIYRAVGVDHEAGIGGAPDMNKPNGFVKFDATAYSDIRGNATAWRETDAAPPAHSGRP